MIYGALWGSVVTWTGATLGALVAFGLARWFGRPFVERMVAKRDWQVLDDWAASNGWKVVLVSCSCWPAVSSSGSWSSPSSRDGAAKSDRVSLGAVRAHFGASPSTFRNGLCSARAAFSYSIMVRS